MGFGWFPRHFLAFWTLDFGNKNTKIHHRHYIYVISFIKKQERQRSKSHDISLYLFATMSLFTHEIVQQYLGRIGFDSRPSPTEENLFALQLAHMQTIPYENLDLHMKHNFVVDDIDVLVNKLIHRKRGGYCYEQNQMFLHLLLALGFDATLLHSRALMDLKPGQSRPMTHVIILVKIGEKRLIADVGGNIAGSPFPLLLDTPNNEAQDMLGEKHRLVKQTDTTYIHDHQLDDGTWAPLYGFNVHFVAEVQDCVIMNWWSQTHPTSRQVNNLIISLYTHEGMKMLHNNILSMRIGCQKPLKRLIETPEEFLRLLMQEFAVPPYEIVGLVVPGTDWPPLNALV